MVLYTWTMFSKNGAHSLGFKDLHPYKALRFPHRPK